LAPVKTAPRLTTSRSSTAVSTAFSEQFKGRDKNIFFSVEFGFLLAHVLTMNPSTKFASFLAAATVLAAVLVLLTPLGQRARSAAKALPDVGVFVESVIQEVENAKTTRAQPATDRDTVATGKALTNVKIPAIRGENNYGWVQLPWGTPVHLLRRNPDSLLVSWDGTVVQVPPAAALTGAIALRAPTSSNFKN
jgi:hypothetical protein